MLAEFSYVLENQACHGNASKHSALPLKSSFGEESLDFTSKNLQEGICN